MPKAVDPAGVQRNRSWPAQAMVDGETVGLDETSYTTRSYTDDRELRPYWNTHCFAVDPALGLLQAWREGFRALVADVGFQAGPCQDVPHQVFCTRRCSVRS